MFSEYTEQKEPRVKIVGSTSNLILALCSSLAVYMFINCLTNG